MINKQVLSKTKNKLILLNTLVVAILFLIFSLCIYVYFYNVTYKKIDHDLYMTYDILINKIGNKLDLKKLPRYKRHQIIYVWEDNKLINSNNDYFNIHRDYNYVKDIKENISIYKYNNYNIRELKKVKNQYTIEIIKIVDVEVTLLNRLLVVLFVGTLISLIVSYFTGMFLTKQSLKPIESSWENQILFIQDASHELRTPLTIIFSKLENITKKQKDTIENQMNNISIIMKEVRRLRKMTSDLLKLSNENAIVIVNKTYFDIYKLIEEIVNSYKDIILMQNKSIEIISKLKDTTINSDIEKVKQLIIIFIDNAIKYTKEKDRIYIDIESFKDKVKISIIDSGIGISEDELPKIFNRFYRGVNLRKENIEGSGVGLAIAKNIISNLNGYISVESKVNKGTIFNIYIPKK